MKTCILGVFLKPRWYYGIFLLLVSVPLSSVGKEMEGLNVFATMSPASVSWKDFLPPDNHRFKASVCSASLWSPRTVPHPPPPTPHGEISVALHLGPRQLMVTNYLEVRVIRILLFPLSVFFDVRRHPSVWRIRVGDRHQKLGPYGTSQHSHL